MENTLEFVIIYSNLFLEINRCALNNCIHALNGVEELCLIKWQRNHKLRLSTTVYRNKFILRYSMVSAII